MTARSSKAWRRPWLPLLILLAAAVPSHMVFMGHSLWLDEVWVANSVLSESLSEMFYYSGWIQVTPALTLILLRGAAELFGDSELTLRLIPWVAGLLTIIVFGFGARQLFSGPLAFASTAFLTANYWAIKYSQQVKQYSLGLLLSAGLMLLILLYWRRGYERATYLGLWALCTLGTFLSWPAAFWSAAAVLVVLRSDLIAGHRQGRAAWGLEKHRRWMLVAVGSGVGLAVNYLVFARPNSVATVEPYWADYYLELTNLSVTLQRFWHNAGDLLIPRLYPASDVVADLLLVLVVAGVGRAVLGTLRGDASAMAVLLVGCVPVGAAMFASFLGQYPVGGYARIIIWMLPGLTVLLFYALEAPFEGIWQRLSPTGGGWARDLCLVAACVSILLCAYIVLGRLGSAPVRAREAMIYLSEHTDETDGIYVHGGMTEAFRYYRRRLNWYPGRVEIGESWWTRNVASEGVGAMRPSRIQSLEVEVAAVVTALGSATIWAFLPAARLGNWSAFLRSEVDRFKGVMASQGCTETQRVRIGEMLVAGYSCASVPASHEPISRAGSP